MTDTTSQAGYRGVWATFKGIQIDTKLAAIQKLQALCTISEKKWWSDMEFLAHRLKSGRIEHTTITVRDCQMNHSDCASWEWSPVWTLMSRVMCR